jgi:hypothetical protein
MFLDKKLQVDFSFSCELPALAICGCEWAFLLGSDHIREHLRGCTTGQAAQRAPQKTTGLPLAGPDQARSLRLSPSRSTACRRDPRRHRGYPAPQLLSPPSPPPSPDPLACARAFLVIALVSGNIPAGPVAARAARSAWH